MTHQTLFKTKYCRIWRITLIGIVGFTLLSCSTQVNVTRFGYLKKSYPPRNEHESIVIYKNVQDIPMKSEQIGQLEASCTKGMENCDSASVFSLAETKINKTGGNALLITKFEKPAFWNNSRLLLNGDVFFISDFSSPPDTLSHKFDSFTEKHVYMGFGAGPETGISLFSPKISYYNFQNRKIVSTYYGIEGCIGLITFPWLSLDCLYGIKKNIFTLDASLGVWWFPKRTYVEEPAGPYFHSTINPKVGIKFWKVWLKAGPSIHIYKDYPKEEKPVGMIDIVKIGNVYYNFEILIRL